MDTISDSCTEENVARINIAQESYCNLNTKHSAVTYTVNEVFTCNHVWLHVKSFPEACLVLLTHTSNASAGGKEFKYAPA